MTIVELPQTIGDTLPADGNVGRFVVSLALYLQDELVAFKAAIAAGKDESTDSWEYAYFSRLAWSHWYESVLAVKRCEGCEDVRAFIARLPAAKRAHLAEAKTVYEKHSSVLSNLRNKTFHYPSPAGEQRPGWDEVGKLLETMSENRLLMPQGRAGDARYLWAEDLAVRRIFEATGDGEGHKTGEIAGFTALAADMSEGTQQYNRFVMAVLDQAQRDGLDAFGKRHGG